LLTGVLRGLERFTGIGLVREIGDFVRAIETLTGALRERVAAVAALLRGEGTALVLVTAPEPRLVAETEALVAALAATGLGIGGIVVNRALSRDLFGAAAPEPAPLDGVPAGLGRRLRRGWADLRALAARQEAALAPLVAHARAPVVGEVPLLPADPGSLAGLVEIGRHLFAGRRDAEAPASGLGR
jgi:anion-transporting  ArsA/GET3 family ATPase